MNERDFIELLTEAMELLIEEERLDCEVPRIKSYRTYEEAMLLTMDKGLVVTTKDGDEFQLRVVQSKFAQE